MKKVFLILKIQDGEHEHYSKTVHEVPVIKSATQFAEEYASTFYGDSGEKNEEGHYEFLGGSIAVEVIKAIDINYADWAVLRKYL